MKFDAAWVGDIDTIKALALDWQNEVERKPPLSLGESDCFGFTPLHIAILRGHWEVANEMIEILHAQHKPHKPRESDFYDDEDENGDGDGDRVIEPPETDDDNISDSESEYDWEEDKEENVQERPKRPAVEYVKLRASPLTVTLLSECPAYLFTERSEVADEFRPWSTQDGSRIFITYSSGQEPKRGLIDHAILMNDIELLRFLLEMTKSLTNRDHRRRTMDSVLREPFLFALKLGRIDCLSMMIEKGGASLFEQKPIYYYQKSPSDKQPTSYTKSPLLAAAMEGNLETTLWMMGPDAIRHYVKYIKSHEDDQRLEKFTNSEDGIEKSVLKWLHHKDELVLHCVIKSKPCEESERLIQYLINRYPEYMEVRSEEGYTPLSLAFILQRPSFAQILINLGADQTVKDNLGNNLLHLLLACPQITPIGSQSCLNADLLREMLGMLNPNGVHVMLLERNKSRCQTPLMRWISSQRDSYGLDTFQNMMNRNRSDRDDQLPVVKLLLSYGGKTQTEQLELIDDNGNSPAHIAVTSKLPALLQLFLEHRPDLLQRENSSGKTPADLASAEWTKFAIDEDRTGRRSPLVINTQFNSASNNVVQRDPLSFVDSEAPIKADKGRPHHRKIHELCHSHASNGNYQRRLFTAGDAAAIARMKVANAPSQFFTRHWLFFEDQSPPLLPIR
ncbi:hypothetical protein VI817_003068 [Penicillium citrinum]|nr:hypothetical protein VI817_003068 [Penicillium citrinum]